jgi:hypothetical protein
LDELPPRRLRRSVCPSAVPLDWRFGRQTRNRGVDGARHQAGQGPSDVTLGGHPAKHVVVTVRQNVGCHPGFFYTWRAVNGGAFWGTTVGDTIKVWIVSVGGTRLFIAAATTGEVNWLTTRLRKTVQQIVESIRFESVVKGR